MSSESTPPDDGGRQRRLLIVAAFVLVTAVAAGVVFVLPFGLGWKESVVIGVFVSVGFVTQTLLDDTTFGADD